MFSLIISHSGWNIGLTLRILSFTRTYMPSLENSPSQERGNSTIR